MLTLNHLEVTGHKAAIRAMRNPLKSWENSDTSFEDGNAYIGIKDLQLAMKLVKAGTSHCKFRRMVTAAFDITAPEYWWKQFDTYKIGTVASSTSTMHTIMKQDLMWSDFSTEHLTGNSAVFAFNNLLSTLNELIRKGEFDSVVQLLPMSYNYTRTISTNYETLSNIYNQRRNHKLKEWRDFCDNLSKFPWYFLITGEVQKQ